MTAVGAARYAGSRVSRVEDARLLTGAGTFVDDIVRPGMLHACFVRSPHPRARIIAVTPAGAGLVARGHEIADRVHGEVLDALPADQRDVLTSALGTLVTGVLAEPVTSERPVRRPRAGNVH